MLKLTKAQIDIVSFIGGIDLNNSFRGKPAFSLYSLTHDIITIVIIKSCSATKVHKNYRPLLSPGTVDQPLLAGNGSKLEVWLSWSVSGWDRVTVEGGGGVLSECY